MGCANGLRHSGNFKVHFETGRTAQFRFGNRWPNDAGSESIMANTNWRIGRSVSMTVGNHAIALKNLLE